MFISVGGLGVCIISFDSCISASESLRASACVSVVLAFLCACMYVSLYLSMYMRMYVCMYMYAYIHIRACMHVYIYVYHACICIYACMYVRRAFMCVLVYPECQQSKEVTNVPRLSGPAPLASAAGGKMHVACCVRSASVAAAGTSRMCLCPAEGVGLSRAPGGVLRSCGTSRSSRGHLCAASPFLFFYFIILFLYARGNKLKGRKR